MIKSVLTSLLLTLSLYSCDAPEGNEKQTGGVSPYLNHGDSATYTGMGACRSCHSEIYNSFIQTGMGKSFDVAVKTKSSADFSRAVIHDSFSDYHYQAWWKNDSLFIKEFRLHHHDTVHQRSAQVNYIIGSGQHTNSHIMNVNGYLSQMPMTYYTQKKHWDLPPGFENGVNTRFSRKIGIECMTCHNAYPGFVMGSENKFSSVPGGIDCERCHGPGSIHVAQRSSGARVDTSRFADYSIVNPSKLPLDAQFDVCQRCHLQGNAVLKEGKSFFDFKPGQKLSDFISVFVPRYSNSDDDFIMASHAERLKQSQCFIRSHERSVITNTLRPGKDAMTCTSCHNPHVSVRETNRNVFNEACLKCHGDHGKPKAELAKAHQELNDWSGCTGCHMPVSGASDIPHVTIHDHYIRKPVTKKQKEKIKQFLGLYAVNDPGPDALTRARGFINQYDKFEPDGQFLDSARKILSAVELNKKLHALIQLYFIRQDYDSIIACVNKAGEEFCYTKMFIHQSYDNANAWAAYRIAEAFLNTGKNEQALRWFIRTVELAPYNPDFRSKLGTTLASLNRMGEAVTEFERIIRENPVYVPAFTNLGYLKLRGGQPEEAIELYRRGEKLDPDNETLLLNLAAYYIYKQNRQTARNYLERLLRINPANIQARAALAQL